MALGIQAAIASLRPGQASLRRAAVAEPARPGPPEPGALREEPWPPPPPIHALGELGDPRAAPALLDLLDDEFSRGPALEALGRVAGRDARPRLIPHLYDPEPALRNVAIRAVVE